MRNSGTQASVTVAKLKDRIPLGKLVELVLDESGFEAALACEFLGSRKLANLRKLVRLARDFSRQESFTLADLVARMRADLDNPPSEEQAATTDEESPSIRLMSIHQAKGLEFPIVVIPDLNRKPTAPDVLLGLHSELGLVVRPPRRPASRAQGEADPGSGASVGWLTYRAIETDEDRREALRLFYVATTRARDHLVLAMGLESEPNPDEPGARLLGAVGSCCLVNPGCPKPVSPALSFPRAFRLANRPLPGPIARRMARAGRASRAGPPSRAGNQALAPLARQRLLEIERTIATAAPAWQIRPELDVRPCPAVPRRIELDLEHDSTARWARLGRLVKGATPGIVSAGLRFRRASLRQAGARQAPAASGALVQLAAEWLELWPTTALFQELRAAARGRTSLSEDLQWTLAWPGSPNDAIVILGRADAIYRDRKRQWRTVVVSVDPRERETDRLRLMLRNGPLRAERDASPHPDGWSGETSAAHCKSSFSFRPMLIPSAKRSSCGFAIELVRRLR